jgi:hypothetical protein
MASRMGALLHREPLPPAAVGEPTAAAAEVAVARSADEVAEAAAAAVRSIALGDLVIVYEGFGKQKAVTLAEKGQFQNRYGNFFHRDWVGKPYGCKVFGKGNAGFVWLLAGERGHHHITRSAAAPPSLSPLPSPCSVPHPRVPVPLCPRAPISPIPLFPAP